MINAKFQGAMWQKIGAGVLGLGVFLMLPFSSMAGESAKTPVTFAKNVAPIFQAKCQECHHPGTAAPMSLVTYEETRPWGDKIKDRVVTRNMPPWHLDRTVGIQHFKNDRSLSDEHQNRDCIAELSSPGQNELPAVPQRLQLVSGEVHHGWSCPHERRIIGSYPF